MMIWVVLKKLTMKRSQNNNRCTKSDTVLKKWLSLEAKWQETHQMKTKKKSPQPKQLEDIEFALEVWKISKMSKKT